MSASTEFNSDYWSNNPYAYHFYNRSNQFFNEVSKHNNSAPLSTNNLFKDGTGGSYQENQEAYSSTYMNESTSYGVKEEPVYNTCRYSINQGYSNVDAQTDKSISPPPINHSFTNNINQFDSCRQGYTSLATSLSSNDSRPNSTINESDDSPVKIDTGESPSALRALLSKPDGKIAYDYSNLHSSAQETYQKSQFNEVFNSDTKALYGKEKVSNNSNQGGDELAGLQNNFYPWMKSNGKQKMSSLTTVWKFEILSLLK